MPSNRLSLSKIKEQKKTKTKNKYEQSPSKPNAWWRVIYLVVYTYLNTYHTHTKWHSFSLCLSQRMIATATQSPDLNIIILNYQIYVKYGNISLFIFYDYDLFFTLHYYNCHRALKKNGCFITNITRSFILSQGSFIQLYFLNTEL